MARMQGSGSPPDRAARPRTASNLPCDECKRSKMRCDRSRPSCGTCSDRQVMCAYSRSDSSRRGRLRQFHRKTRSGCSSCKTRRVRCDEQRPVCGACSRRGEGSLCAFPHTPDLEINAKHSAPESHPPDLALLFEGRHDFLSDRGSSRTNPVGSQPLFEQPHFHPASTYNKAPTQYGHDRLVPLQDASESPSFKTTDLQNSVLVSDPGMGSSSEWTVGFVSEPDPLRSFFPSMLERQQFQHFLFDTAQSLLAVPSPHVANPWLTYLAPLAIGKSKGEDISHDALRSSLLSLASSDLSIKLSAAVVGTDTITYSSSCEYWRRAMAEMQLAVDLGMHLEDGGAADMLLASALTLGTRDRIAGWADWEQPLALGHRVLRELGGLDLYITSNPTRLRRFLVEQLVSLEILGCMTTFKEPNIGDWYNHWLDTPFPNEQSDHLGAIYGWDREALVYSLRGIALGGEHVRLLEMRKNQASNSSVQVQEKIRSKLADCQSRIQALVVDSRCWHIRDSTVAALSATEMRSLCLQACVDLYLMMVCTEGRNTDEVLQSRVASIFRIASEIMSRGEVAGLLLPLTWAEGCATVKYRDPILKLLQKLGSNYHMDRPSLLRIIGVDWADLGAIFPAQWETYARREGLYFPVY